MGETNKKIVEKNVLIARRVPPSKTEYNTYPGDIKMTFDEVKKE